MLRGKGLSNYISHILAVAIAFLILSLIASSMYDYYVDLTMESQRSEAMALSEDLGNKIMDMYSQYGDVEIIPQQGETEVLTSTEVDVPDDVGGRNYNLRLNSSRKHWIETDLEATAEVEVVDSRRPTARVVVEVTEFPEGTYKYHMYNIETNMTGHVSNPRKVKLEYVRVNDGEVEDLIRMSRAGS
ncbi:MAG: hypothetical protein ACLFM9_04270 [Candidatus Aenigmatarchaeota archaeon]